MPANAAAIESLMEEADLIFYRKDDDRWMLAFQSAYMTIHLKEEGEFLLFRGSCVADLSEVSPKERHRALEHFMEVNDRIKLGRFCGVSDVAFEIGLPIEDSELTAAQFHRCLRATAKMTDISRSSS